MRPLACAAQISDRGRAPGPASSAWRRHRTRPPPPVLRRRVAGQRWDKDPDILRFAMGGDVHTVPPGEPRETRAALVAELRRLEDQLQRAQGRLFAFGGEALTGIHLVIETGGRRGLLSAARVLEVVRMVQTHP